MVVHIITRLALGGAQQFVYEIAKRMHESKNDVVIFTGLSDINKSLSGKNNKILDEVYRYKIPVEIVPHLYDHISLLNDLKALIWLCKKLKEYQPSLVHIHSSKTGILGRLACKIANVPRIIYHVHGWSFSRSVGLTRRFYLMLEKLFFRLTTEYIFVCKQDMLDFIELGGNPHIKYKSHIVYPCANFFEPSEQNRYRIELRKNFGFNKDDFVIGTVARLDYQKNPHIFLEIASLFAKANNNVKFLWIGNGEYRNEIKKQIDRLGLSNKFVLPGFIDEVEPYFSVFDIFFITSRYEGLPVTAIKALACGIPIVAFLVNGIKDLSSRFKSVLGINPYKIEEFVKQLVIAQKMIQTEKAVLKEEAKYVRENFNFDRTYERIDEIYKS